MMLAGGLEFHVKVLLALPLLLLGWLTAGGWLLYVGWRYVAGVREATYWRAVGCYATAEVCLFLYTVLGSLSAVALTQGGAKLSVIAAGALWGLVMFWLVLSSILSLPLRKAVLAWLPVLPIHALWFGPVVLCLT